MATRVADMSMDELRLLIQETVAQTLMEILSSLDEDLELREYFTDALQRSLAAVQSGEATIDADKVATKLGLSW